jgi:ethanolamine ammonia-lyase small subunit
MTNPDDKLARDRWNELERKVRAQTPARLLQGRSGEAYRTDTQMDLREAHAAARDAVRAEFNLSVDLDPDLVRDWKLFEVSSQAANKDEYLLRPDLGRRLSVDSRATILERCLKNSDLQIVVGDGLSVTAVVTQVPALLPILQEKALALRWTLGAPFMIRHCRVGILNEIGDLLHPKVVVLLIGERPGLATAESLSAYMAYKPKSGDTDANRNLISNIHARGVLPADAAARITQLAAAMMTAQTSGCLLREGMPRAGLTKPEESATHLDERD